MVLIPAHRACPDHQPQAVLFTVGLQGYGVITAPGASCSNCGLREVQLQARVVDIRVGRKKKMKVAA